MADFSAGPHARLIAIKVMRIPGNPLIKGKFWLDDVKIPPVATGADHWLLRASAPVRAALCINGTRGHVAHSTLLQKPDSLRLTRFIELDRPAFPV
jgi:hypothetical protein